MEIKRFNSQVIFLETVFLYKFIIYERFQLEFETIQNEMLYITTFFFQFTSRWILLLNASCFSWTYFLTKLICSFSNVFSPKMQQKHKLQFRRSKLIISLFIFPKFPVNFQPKSATITLSYLENPKLLEYFFEQK